MAFQFGGNVQTSLKNVAIPKHDCLLYDHWKPNQNYYIILTEFVITNFELKLLIKDIDSSGIQSYCIISCVNVKKIDDTSTKTLLTLESNWRDFLEMNGKRVDAIIALGHSIRVLNKSADVTWMDFLATTFFESRYWCGKEFVNGPDCWVYPAADSETLYPIKCKNSPTNWTTRFFREQLEKAQKEDLSSNSLDMRDYKIIVANNKQEASEYLKSLIDSELLAVDTETSGLHFKRNTLGTLQLSADGEISYFFDWTLVDIRLLNKVLLSAKKTVLANGKFDTKFLWENGTSKKWLYTDDITLLAHALHSDRPKGLKPSAIFWCGKFTGYDLELEEIKSSLKVKSYLEIPFDTLKNYAGLDAIVTWRVYHALLKAVKKIDKKFPNEKVKEWTIEKWYREVMIPNSLMVTKVEFEGLYFNKQQFYESEKEIQSEITRLKNELSKLWNVDTSFPFESTKELGLLFERMGWPKIGESKAGGFKTSDEVLTEYESQGYKGIKELKNLRSNLVGLNTFIKGWGEHLVHHKDGTYRIHPSLNSFGTVSFRHSMKRPNFQQLPSGSIMASSIKKLFTVPPITKYKVTDNNGNIFEGKEDDYIQTKRGKIKFKELIETDEIA